MAPILELEFIPKRKDQLGGIFNGNVRNQCRKSPNPAKQESKLGAKCLIIVG
jgi:hypothetical protein